MMMMMVMMMMATMNMIMIMMLMLLLLLLLMMMMMDGDDDDDDDGDEWALPKPWLPRVPSRGSIALCSEKIRAQSSGILDLSQAIHLARSLIA